MAEIFSVHIDDDKNMLNFVTGKPCMYTIRINQSIGNQLNVGSGFVADELEQAVLKLMYKYANMTEADRYIAILNEEMSENVDNQRVGK